MLTLFLALFIMGLSNTNTGEDELNKIHKPYQTLEQFFKDSNVPLVVVSCSLGISLTSLYNKLKGRSDFTLSEALVLMDKYGVTPDLFCN